MKITFELTEFDGWYYLEGKFDNDKHDYRFVEYDRKPRIEKVVKDKNTIIRSIQNYITTISKTSVISVMKEEILDLSKPEAVGYSSIEDKSPKFKVGDKVKILKCNIYPQHVGKIATITDSERYCDYINKRYKYIIKIYNKNSDYVYEEDDLEKVEDKTPKFKVGDRVKIFNSPIPGVIFQIYESGLTGFNYEVKFDDGLKRYFFEENIRKIEEPVQVDTCEFKVGDLVQVTSDKAIHCNRFGIVTFVNDILKQCDVDMGHIKHTYFFTHISKPKRDVILGSKEFKPGAVVQVRGKRFDYSQRYGILTNYVGNKRWGVNFGIEFYQYHKKNLKLI